MALQCQHLCGDHHGEQAADGQLWLPFWYYPVFVFSNCFLFLAFWGGGWILRHVLPPPFFQLQSSFADRISPPSLNIIITLNDSTRYDFVLGACLSVVLCSHNSNRLTLCNDHIDDCWAPIYGLHPAIPSSLPWSCQVRLVCKFLNRGHECQLDVELCWILSGKIMKLPAAVLGNAFLPHCLTFSNRSTAVSSSMIEHDWLLGFCFFAIALSPRIFFLAVALPQFLLICFWCCPCGGAYSVVSDILVLCWWQWWWWQWCRLQSWVWSQSLACLRFCLTTSGTPGTQSWASWWCWLEWPSALWVMWVWMPRVSWQQSLLCGALHSNSM